MLGNWKNIEELEECLNLDELRLILQAERERELRSHKFFAALKGIDLDSEAAGSAEDRVREIKERVAARQAGMTEQEAEFDVLGTDYEVEE